MDMIILSIILQMISCPIILTMTIMHLIGKTTPVWLQIIAGIMLVVSAGINTSLLAQISMYTVVVTGVAAIVWGWVILNNYSTTMYEKDRKKIRKLWDTVFVMGLLDEFNDGINADMWRDYIDELRDKELQQLEQWK
jgi:hypothetical protein